MRLEEGAQQLAQRGGIERTFAEPLVEVQVQAGHVDAAHVGILQVDVGGNQRAGLDQTTRVVLDAHRHLDFVHAHPVELAGDFDLRLVGDVGHVRHGVFKWIHMVRSGPEPRISVSWDR